MPRKDAGQATLRHRDSEQAYGSNRWGADDGRSVQNPLPLVFIDASLPSVVVFRD